MFSARFLVDACRDDSVVTGPHPDGHKWNSASLYDLWKPIAVVGPEVLPQATDFSLWAHDFVLFCFVF